MLLAKIFKEFIIFVVGQISNEHPKSLSMNELNLQRHRYVYLQTEKGTVQGSVAVFEVDEVREGSRPFRPRMVVKRQFNVFETYLHRCHHRL